VDIAYSALFVPATALVTQLARSHAEAVARCSAAAAHACLKLGRLVTISLDASHGRTKSPLLSTAPTGRTSGPRFATDRAAGLRGALRQIQAASTRCDHVVDACAGNTHGTGCIGLAHAVHENQARCLSRSACTQAQ